MVQYQTRLFFSLSGAPRGEHLQASSNFLRLQAARTGCNNDYLPIQKREACMPKMQLELGAWPGRMRKGKGKGVSVPFRRRCDFATFPIFRGCDPLSGITCSSANSRVQGQEIYRKDGSSRDKSDRFGPDT